MQTDLTGADRGLARLLRAADPRSTAVGERADRDAAGLRPRAAGARALPARLGRPDRRCSRRAASSTGRSSSIRAMPRPTPISGLTYIVDHVKRLTGEAGPARPGAGLAQVREAIRLEPDLALGLPGPELRPGRERRLRGRHAGGRARGRAQPERSRQPDVAGQGAGSLRRLRGGGRPTPSAPAACTRWRPQYYPYVHGQALYAAGPPGGGRGGAGRLPAAACRTSATACASGSRPWSGSTGSRRRAPLVARLIAARSGLLGGRRAAAAALRRLPADGALRGRPQTRRRAGGGGAGLVPWSERPEFLSLSVSWKDWRERDGRRLDA